MPLRILSLALRIPGGPTTNYKPGDTFKPLEKLLSEYEAVRMGLFEHNVYCFDSESFRYLAA